MTTDEKLLLSTVEGSGVSHKLWVLLLMGFLIVLIGFTLLIVAAVLSGEGSVSFGGFILIGPIPIIFGAGPEAPWLVLFAIMLTVLGVVMFLIMRREVRR
jgi:uncharacterized membrane protein